MKLIRRRILCFALLLLTSLVCMAEPPDMVVSAEGTILKLQEGRYGDLFPGGSAADPDNFVLALDVMRNGSQERILVPGTEGNTAETLVALHYEKDSGLTYLLWEGVINGVHPFLFLANFDGAQWSNNVQIAGNVFAEKGRAQFVIRPEPKRKEVSNLLDELSVNRSSIYVGWQEGDEKYLVPVILQDGIYAGWHQDLRLQELAKSKDKALDLEKMNPFVAPELADLLKIQASANGNAVIAGFTDVETGRLMTLEVELLPQALTMLATRVRELVEEHGLTSDSVGDLAARVHEAMMGYNQDFHDGTLTYLASQVRELILQHASVAAATAPGLLEKMGIHIIHVGARVRSKGLVESNPTEILELGRNRGGEGAIPAYFKVSILGDRELPEVGGPATLFLSSTGSEVLVAWAEGNRVGFRESEGAEWSEVQMIDLTDNLDQAAIYRILADRTVSR